MTKLLACCLALVASAAFAVTDAIEIQIPTARVLPLLADRARATVSCVAPINSGSTTYYVDHVDFPSAPSVRRSPTTKTIKVNDLTQFTGTPLQIALPVKTYLKTSARLNDRTASQNTYDLEPTSTLVFELSTKMGSPQKLCADLVAVESPFGSGDSMLSAMKDTIGRQCFPLQFDGIDDLLQGRTQVTGLGMSSNADLSVLAFRLEFGNPVGDPVAWRNFHEGAMSSLGRTGDAFAIGFDTELFAKVLRGRFADAVEAPVRATSGMNTQWKPNQPGLDLWFNADVDVDMCLNDIAVEPISTSMYFLLGEGGTSVKLLGTVSTDLVDSDVLLCGLPLAGAGALLSPVLFPVIEGVISGIAGDQGMPDDALPPQCSTSNDDSFTCSFPLTLPSLDAGGMSLLHLDLKATSLSRVGSNLVIKGTTEERGPLTYVARASIQSPVRLSHGVQGSCSSLSIGTEAPFIAQGTGVVCAPMVITRDPQYIFVSQYLNEVREVPWNRQVEQWGNPTSLPYSSSIVVRTSGGARTVELIAAEPMTEAESDDLVHQRIAAKANCMAKEDGLFGIPGMFDPRWRVDPPYDQLSRVRSFDPAWSRVNVRARLDKLKFETLGRTTRPQTKMFDIAQQDVRITGIATIDFGAKGKKTVNVSTVVRAAFGGKEIGKTGIVTGQFPAGTIATFQTNSTTFPSGVSGVDIELDLSPGKLELQGTLNQQ